MKTLSAVLVSGMVPAFFIACCHWQSVGILRTMATCKRPVLTLEEYFLPLVTGLLLLGYRHCLRNAVPRDSRPGPGGVRVFWPISTCASLGLFASVLAQGYGVNLEENVEAFAGLARGNVPAADVMGRIGGLWVAVGILWLPVAGLLSLLALLPRDDDREVSVPKADPPEFEGCKTDRNAAGSHQVPRKP